MYRGIDLVYYGSSRQLEYDFIVAPGAGPDAITLGFEGADRLEVDSEGDLVLSTASGLILFKRPVVYQEQAVGRVSIASDYVWKGSDRIGFRAAVYDTALPLIIDPVLSYSTYLGGSGEETAMDIAVDGSGAAYITGFTNSPDFPTRSPLQTMPAGPSDAFVMKLAPDGPSLVYSTYLGGELK